MRTAVTAAVLTTMMLGVSACSASEIEVTREVPVEIRHEIVVTQEVQVPVEAVREVEVTRNVEVPVEVTREIVVTREIEVSVEKTREVEVTREIEVTREVEVPVEVTRVLVVPKEIEVVREVEVVREIEVTREIEATRIVEVMPEFLPEVEVTRIVEVVVFATPSSTPVATEEELDALVDGNTAFALNLYRLLADSDSNVFYSPHSISTVLAMMYVGARGETARQMASTLDFRLPQDRLHPAFNDLALSLTSQEMNHGGAELSIANAVWGQTGYMFLPSYIDTITRNYSEGLKQADFQGMPKDAVRSINGWAADNTDNRINNLISADDITPLTRLVLANAIYFKGTWWNEFETHDTYDRPFHLLDGATVSVPMMHQGDRINYFSGDGLQAVELPYEGDKLSMLVLLPDEGRFREFESTLDLPLLRRVLQDMRGAPIILGMPKFKLETSYDLTGTLKEMGMVNAFDDTRAEFQGMGGESCLENEICLLISKIAQKALVSVDESGTEAVAVSFGTAPDSISIPPPPIELTIDRPFVFVILDRVTRALLFVGRVLEP